MNETNKEYDATGLSNDEIAILESAEPQPQAETEPALENTGSGAVEAEKAEDPPNPAADPARPDGYVPYKALKAERERAKQLEQKFAEAQRWQQTIAEKLAEARANPQPQAEQQDRIPDRDADPLGYIEYMDKRLAAIEQERQAHFQQQQEEMQWRNFEASVNDEVTSAISEDPVNGEVLEFVNRAIAYEWDKVYSRTGVPLQQYMQQIKRQHSAYARQNGIPIAQYMRAVAEARGFAPGILAPLKQQPQAASTDPAAAQKINAIADAQSRNKTLGKNASGTGSDFTLEDLAAMSAADLERFAAKNPDLFERIASGQ